MGVLSTLATLYTCAAGSGCAAVESSATAPSPEPSVDASSSPPLPDAAPGAPETGMAAEDSAAPAIDAGGTCAPEDVTTFVPMWHPPVGPFTGQCTDAQLDKVIAACFAKTATQTTCNAWLSAPSNMECEGCWLGQASSSSTNWAPFLYADNPGTSYYINVPGCIALANPALVQCATSLQAVFSCDLAACLYNCPIPTTGTTAEMAAVATLSKCFDAAGAAGCWR